MPKYSADQIVRGINHFASEYLCESFHLNLDAPLHCHLETLETQEICPLMFIEELASYFGFSFPEHRVIGWLKLSKRERRLQTHRHQSCRGESQHSETQRTGHDLVRFFIRKSECPSFSPRNLLGNNCKSAGYFLGISELVLSHQRFTPSTPIRDVLTDGQYRALARRLEWMLGCNDLQPIMQSPHCWIDAFSRLIFWISLASFLAVSITQTSLPLVLVIIVFPFFATCLWIACNSMASEYKRRIQLEMGKGIITFRDLTVRVLLAPRSLSQQN